MEDKNNACSSVVSVITQKTTDSAETRNAIKTQEPQSDYSGTYQLIVTRNGDYQIKHLIELEQLADSVKAVYSASFYMKGEKPFAEVKGSSYGKLIKIDNMDGVMLLVAITESQVDSLVLTSYNWSKNVSVPTMEYGTAFALRFPPGKNTIEHNYAGGEWDTWEKIK